jgi:hypothetical protein
MTPEALLVALHTAGISLVVAGEKLRTRGPKGALTPELADALRKHKALILAVVRTLHDRKHDADWETVRAWMIDGPPIFTPALLRAARAIGFPVGDREWPPAFAERFRLALRVRGIMRAFEEPRMSVVAGHIAEAPPAQKGA